MKIIDDSQVEMKPTGFGYLNKDARVVLVGITPGNTQLDGERDGLDEKEIKRRYAFGGRMRPNLVSMLDCAGINYLLGIASCGTLWDEDFDKVEMTSLLKDATFYKNKMFSRARDIRRSVKMTNALREGFAADCALYSKAVLYIGMGEQVGEVLCALKDEGIIRGEVVWIPHPSGANAERVAVFLERKACSPKPACCKAKAQAALVKRIVLGITVR